MSTIDAGTIAIAGPAHIIWTNARIPGPVRRDHADDQRSHCDHGQRHPRQCHHPEHAAERERKLSRDTPDHRQRFHPGAQRHRARCAGHHDRQQCVANRPDRHSRRIRQHGDRRSGRRNEPGGHADVPSAYIQSGSVDGASTQIGFDLAVLQGSAPRRRRLYPWQRLPALSRHQRSDRSGLLRRRLDRARPQRGHHPQRRRGRRHLRRRDPAGDRLHDGQFRPGRPWRQRQQRQPHLRRRRFRRPRPIRRATRSSTPTSQSMR